MCGGLGTKGTVFQKKIGKSLTLKASHSYISGQATVEYILLLSFIFGSAILLKDKVLDTIDTSLLTFGSRLESQLKTGRVPTDVWKSKED